MKNRLLLGAAAISIFASLSFAQTIATVDGKNITTEDVQQFLKVMPGVSYDTLPAEMKEKVLNQVIDKYLLLKEAKRDGIEDSKEFKDALESAKEDLALDTWMKKQFDKIEITNADAKKYYESNKEKFKQPASYRARHILVKNEADAKKIIKELGAAKKEGLQDAFAEAAKKSSIDGSAQSGGELGWFAEGQMVKPFFDAAKALKKGEITKTPVKTQFGFHLIYLEDTKAAGTASYESVEDKIKQAMKVEKFKDGISDKAKKLREKAKVETKKDTEK